MTSDPSALSRRTVVAALGAGALLAACGGGGSGDDPTTTSGPIVDPTTTSTSPPTTAATTTAAPAAAATSPLTGLPAADPARLARPSLAIKIANAPTARPQSGLEHADITYEEIVEGDIVRFLAIFHSKDAPVLGPVRSVRAEDGVICTPLKGYFAYSGGAEPFKQAIRKAPVTLVGFDELSSAYRRRADKRAPDNLYTSTGDIYGKAPKLQGQQPPPLLRYRAAGQPLAGGSPAATASLRYGSRTDASWAFDAASGMWQRTTNGTPHLLEGGGRLAHHNVVLQQVGYQDTGVRDASGAASPEALVVGEGECLVLSGPSVVRGRWRRRSAAEVTEYLGPDGQPILLLPGTTWIGLPRTGTPVAVA